MSDPIDDILNRQRDRAKQKRQEQQDAEAKFRDQAELDVLQARDILRARRKLGLSQADLARRAGVRAETINRIEHGKNTPSVPTIVKIDRALRAAEADGPS